MDLQVPIPSLPQDLACGETDDSLSPRPNLADGLAVAVTWAQVP